VSTGAQERARAALLKKWKQHPTETEPAEVAAALLGISPVREFVRRSSPASEDVIREIIRSPRSFRAFFLAEMMRAAPEPGTKAAWAAALSALLDLETFADLRLDERLARARTIVQDPRVLQAIQTAVVGNGGAGPHELLAADGSAASVDALLPSALAAQREGGYRLRWFERMLSRGAKTSEMKEMIASLGERKHRTEEASPALAFARALGLAVDRMKLSVSFYSPGFYDADASEMGVHIQGQVDIDSTVPGWLRVFISVSRGDGTAAGHQPMGDTTFGNEEALRDGLGLGRCEALELPSWLAQVQRRLATEWQVGEVSGSLRGKRRAQFVDWLFAPSRGK